MKSLVLFIRTTLTGGIIFLLPVVLLLIFLTKAFKLLSKMSKPIAEKLPDLILGFDGSKLLTILLLILLCFLAGLLFRSMRVKRWTSALEKNVLAYLPGYLLTKTITADAIGEQADQDMTPILIRDGENWNLAFLVEEEEKSSTVFIPDAPRHDAGEIKIVPTASVRKLDVSSTKFTQCIKLFGKGALQWTKKTIDQ